MRMRAPVLPLLIVVAVGSALAGCAPAAPPVTVPPSPSSTPVFASEEEALAAAEEAYGAYLAMSDLIANAGGADPERIAPFVTKGQLQNELDSFQYFAQNDVHSFEMLHSTRWNFRTMGLPGMPPKSTSICVWTFPLCEFWTRGVST